MGVVVHISNLSTWEADVKELQVGEASMDYIRQDS